MPASAARTSVREHCAAAEAGLHYINDRQPGIRRHAKQGGGFRYRHSDGRLVRDEKVLSRIARLAIPPAYEAVWISPNPDGHLQATGRDQRGRKQYRYHPEWRAVRDTAKYQRMAEFGAALPGLRRQIERDLRVAGLPREKVLALILRLLETTLIRVGNEEYARTNRSFGLTTLRNRHVDVRGGAVKFSFRGKSGVWQRTRVDDVKLARLIRRCMELPGQELFQYLDADGKRCSVDSGVVNDYLRAAAGADFTAKDYRTWAGSVMALRSLRAAAKHEGDPSWDKRPEKQLVATIREVARRLGNTPAVCRKCYVHPAVIEAHLAGELAEPRDAVAARPRRGLRADESAFLAFLARAGEASRRRANRV